MKFFCNFSLFPQLFSKLLRNSKNYCPLIPTRNHFRLRANLLVVMVYTDTKQNTYYDKTHIHSSFHYPTVKYIVRKAFRGFLIQCLPYQFYLLRYNVINFRHLVCWAMTIQPRPQRRIATRAQVYTISYCVVKRPKIIDFPNGRTFDGIHFVSLSAKRRIYWFYHELCVFFFRQKECTDHHNQGQLLIESDVQLEFREV